MQYVIYPDGTIGLIKSEDTREVKKEAQELLESYDNHKQFK